jgi:hypothetical protein
LAERSFPSTIETAGRQGEEGGKDRAWPRYYRVRGQREVRRIPHAQHPHTQEGAENSRGFPAPSIGHFSSPSDRLSPALFLSKQRKSELWLLVSLRKNRRTRLLQDVQSSKLSRLGRNVHVTNSRFG